MHPPLESDEEGLSKNVMGSGIVVVLALTVILFPLFPGSCLCCFSLSMSMQHLSSPYWDPCDADKWIDTLRS